MIIPMFSLYVENALKWEQTWFLTFYKISTELILPVMIACLKIEPQINCSQVVLD